MGAAGALFSPAATDLAPSVLVDAGAAGRERTTELSRSPGVGAEVSGRDCNAASGGNRARVLLELKHERATNTTNNNPNALMVPIINGRDDLGGVPGRTSTADRLSGDAGAGIGSFAGGSVSSGGGGASKGLPRAAQKSLRFCRLVVTTG